MPGWLTSFQKRWSANVFLSMCIQMWPNASVCTRFCQCRCAGEWITNASLYTFVSVTIFTVLCLRFSLENLTIKSKTINTYAHIDNHPSVLIKTVHSNVDLRLCVSIIIFNIIVHPELFSFAINSSRNSDYQTQKQNLSNLHKSIPIYHLLPRNNFFVLYF